MNVAQRQREVGRGAGSPRAEGAEGRGATSPITGIVASDVQPGEKVAFDTPLFTIVDLTTSSCRRWCRRSTFPSSGTACRSSSRSTASAIASSCGRIERINPSTEPGTRAILVFVGVPNPDTSCAAACSRTAARASRRARRDDAAGRPRCAARPARRSCGPSRTASSSSAWSSSAAATRRTAASRSRRRCRRRSRCWPRKLRQPEGRRAGAGEGRRLGPAKRAPPPRRLAAREDHARAVPLAAPPTPTLTPTPPCGSPASRINNPVFATMVMVALTVLGIFSYERLRVEQMPDVTLPFLIVQIALSGRVARGRRDRRHQADRDGRQQRGRRQASSARSRSRASAQRLRRVPPRHRHVARRCRTCATRWRRSAPASRATSKEPLISAPTTTTTQPVVYARGAARTRAACATSRRSPTRSSSRRCRSRPASALDVNGRRRAAGAHPDQARSACGATASASTR